MAIESDVLVIGGGLAGRIAALAAAERGATVRVVTASSSSLRQASGLIDVLGYDGEGPVVDPFESLPDSGGHPYAKVGEVAIREGLGVFDAAVGDLYRGSHTDRNALVPTSGGRVKPTARYPRSVEPGLASDGRDCLLVGLESHTDFDAPLAADRLREVGVPFRVRGVTVEFSLSLRADAGSTRYARAVDRDEERVRSGLARRIEGHLDGEDRVGLPALLGVDDTGAIREELRDRLGVPVFEIPTGPPSVPGMRLADALSAALSAAGVRVTSGEPVVGYEENDGRIDRVLVDPERRVPHAARAFVLATGGLVGGGIDSNRDAVREPVFDCHLSHPDDRRDWYEDDPFGDHAFARFGVEIDADARPLDSGGDPAFENLWAAGGVVGGANPAAEKSGSGVSIATGYVAGSEAAKRARTNP